MLPWILLLLAVAAIGVMGFFLHKRGTYEDRLERRLQGLRQEKRILFDFLHDLGEAFSESVDQHQMLEIILDSAQKVCDAHGGVIYLWNADRTALRAETVKGFFPPPMSVDNQVADKFATRVEYLETFLKSEPLLADGVNILLDVSRNNEPVLIHDAEGDPRFPVFKEESLKVRTYMAVPLNYRGEKLGVIALANREDGHPFNRQDFDVIQSVADQASFSLHSATTYRQLADKRKMDHDLNVAHEIQQILLPRHPPAIAGYDLYALNIPAQQVSGDYYDFIAVDESRIGLAIADVSGKGIPASLIMAMCRSVLRSRAPGLASPAAALRELNRQLFPDIREDMFITMAYLVLDYQTHELRVARAGHEAPLLATDNFAKVESIKGPGMALGIDGGDIFNEVVEDVVIPLQPGDTVIAYTDGINEALDEHGEEFGRAHIKEAIPQAGGQGVEFLIKNIVERVQRFAGEQPQSDDITMAALQRNKE
ncbi:MAG: GAF domain-containing SpoIIE family protein phosphatase [Verrucomicrobiota bacterium]